MMTETTGLTLSVLALALAIFWVGYRIGHRKPRSTLSKFKKHNDRLERLLTTEAGRTELVRFAIYETALAELLESAQREVEATAAQALPVEKTFIKKIASAVSFGGKKVAGSVYNKLLKKANSLVTGWSDRGSDNDEDSGDDED